MLGNLFTNYYILIIPIKLLVMLYSHFIILYVYALISFIYFINNNSFYNYLIRYKYLITSN
jgi:hypothetical protein